MRDICPLCERRISDWEAAGNKTILIAGQVVHKSCALIQDETISQLQAKIRLIK